MDITPLSKHVENIFIFACAILTISEMIIYLSCICSSKVFPEETLALSSFKDSECVNCLKCEH